MLLKIGFQRYLRRDGAFTLPSIIKQFTLKIYWEKSVFNIRHTNVNTLLHLLIHWAGYAPEAVLHLSLLLQKWESLNIWLVRQREYVI